MQIFRDLTPSNIPTAVALGYFDGVHMGHKEVINSAVKCKKQGLVPVAFTFSSTPKPKNRTLQLSTYEEKQARLNELGIEILYIIEFDLIKNKTPKQFVAEIVQNIFNAKKVFCGFNYKFGKFGAGTTHDLITLCNNCNIEVGVSDPIVMDGKVVSSTEIRNLLQKGDIKTANKFLGYDFGVVSKSIEGNHIGTAMETPTINQKFEENIVLPKFGVYASVVTIKNEKFCGVTNIGVKPTVSDGNAPLCETWLPLYKGSSLYGNTVDVRLKEFIRPEQKFSNFDELQSAIKRDGSTAVKIIQKMTGINK